LTFDLTSGFWQQSLQKKSRQYTTFSVPGKGARDQWRVTPMGLQGSLALFARLMDFVMTGVKGIITYIDDILVHFCDLEQHLKSIEEVLCRLRKYGSSSTWTRGSSEREQCNTWAIHCQGKE
jgi:hypothetical protein